MKKEVRFILVPDSENAAEVLLDFIQQQPDNMAIFRLFIDEKDVVQYMNGKDCIKEIVLKYDWPNE